jgi:hypothetical protein
MEDWKREYLAKGHAPPPWMFNGRFSRYTPNTQTRKSSWLCMTRRALSGYWRTLSLSRQNSRHQLLGSRAAPLNLGS